MHKKRTHKNKGISPLIATVLIIGFVLLIGSMVMIWGTDIFKKYQTESGEKAMMELTCTTKVDLNIKEACDLGKSIRIKVENQADQKIESLIYRIISPSGAAIETINEPLSPFEIKTFYPEHFAIDNFFTKPTKIELLPRILIDGKEKTCSGVSKEIKTCFILPSLESLDDGWIIDTNDPDAKKVLLPDPSCPLNPVYGSGICVSSTQSITITSKEFVIPQEAKLLQFNIVGLTVLDSDITATLSVTGENSKVISMNVRPTQPIGEFTVADKFTLNDADKGKTAVLIVTKSNGGSLAINNLHMGLQ